ncbi:hypothetical protein Q0Z83_045450 [Actinoplanes sichuanensis]|uniref:Uncharacterized protein n=1 Tax=Actinoplanes sichuanensis TaxID=512349 RepID=A0ABW4AAD3_9ACTN|nr:hypothetical protein [Actinoplanes sichuanensis]BEL06354.1 hypothetical protein Q0Z83_045450 [Actinoplanes sichuanensis]
MGIANRADGRPAAAGSREPHGRTPNGPPGAATAIPRQRTRPDRVQRLRELADSGRLAATAATADPAQRAELTGAAYDVAWPIVYARVTRRFELLRGHPVCATGVANLADECLDRFHDDVEAVVADLLQHARRPVRGLEAWISRRLVAATVDGHRRRRGARGALQRPRVPGWIADGLGRDPWLTALALEILTWVGVSVTAGAEVWPVEAWAQRRAAVTGDWAGSTPAVAARDVETVLAVIRRRPRWYESYVERPLGAKQPPVALFAGEVVTPLALNDPDDRIETELLQLAADAVQAVEARLSGGEPAEKAVAEVIRTVFGGVGAAGLDQAPHTAADPLGDVSRALTDTATMQRVVSTTLSILGRHH